MGQDLVKMHQNDTQFHANFTDNIEKELNNTNVKFSLNGVVKTKILRLGT